MAYVKAPAALIPCRVDASSAGGGLAVGHIRRPTPRIATSVYRVILEKCEYFTNEDQRGELTPSSCL